MFLEQSRFLRHPERRERAARLVYDSVKLLFSGLPPSWARPSTGNDTIKIRTNGNAPI